MGIINAIAEFLQKLFQWWFTVMPWEQAIHVRSGKHVKLRAAGLYFRIPFIDAVYKQTTRMRMVDTPMQTISSKDGTCVTIKSTIGYKIKDVQKLYNTLYHPEMTLNSMSMGFISEFIRKTNMADITPASIEAYVKSNINSESYGLADFSVKVTSFAIVKTFRLIQDGSSLYEGLSMDVLK